MPLPAAFQQCVLPQITLRGLRKLSGFSCLSCSCGGALSVGLAVSWCSPWFSTLCRALLLGAVVLGRLPFGVSAFSDTVCLAYCCAGGLGWAATLPLCSQCFSCAGWLAGVRWVLHPVSGSSHWGCDCSLGGCVMVPYGAP